jgi:CheY-like chemotaxis protein
MKVLVADDDRIGRLVLASNLCKWGHEVCQAEDGTTGWELLQADPKVNLAFLDWEMPGLDGLEVCRRVRALPPPRLVYAILLTARSGKADLVQGFAAGADDYLTKPFDPNELYARLQVGVRVLRLQQSLADQVRRLADALARVQQLQGLLPICAYCKSIRNDQNYWQQVEHYLAAHSDLRFSHGICPNCFRTHVQPQLDAQEPGRRQPVRSPHAAPQ